MWALLLSLSSKVFSTPVFLWNLFVNSHTTSYYIALCNSFLIDLLAFDSWSLPPWTLSSFGFQNTKLCWFSPSQAIPSKCSPLSIPPHLLDYIILTSENFVFGLIFLFTVYFLEIPPSLIASNLYFWLEPLLWIFNFFLDTSTQMYDRHLSQYWTPPLPPRMCSFCITFPYQYMATPSF